MKMKQALAMWSFLLIFFALGWYFKEQLPTLLKTFQGQADQHWPFFLGLLCLCLCLPIPGTRIIAISAGAFFGFSQGMMMIYLASLIGATVSFLISRHYLRNQAVTFLESQSPELVAEVNANTNVYLFALRFNPLMSFSIVNILMGISQVKTALFLITSALAALLYAGMYAFLGERIGLVITDNVSLPWSWLVPVALLSFIPLLWRKSPVQEQQS